MSEYYLSVVCGDGINPKVKYVLCDDLEEPLFFMEQLNALNFWEKYKDKFDVPKASVIVRGTPQWVQRPGKPVKLWDDIEDGTRNLLKPLSGYIIEDTADEYEFAVIKY